MIKNKFEDNSSKLVPLFLQVFTWEKEEEYRAKYEQNLSNSTVEWPSKESWKKWWSDKSEPTDYEDWCIRMEAPIITPLPPRT